VSAEMLARSPPVEPDMRISRRAAPYTEAVHSKSPLPAAGRAAGCAVSGAARDGRACTCRSRVDLVLISCKATHRYPIEK
jgi:hypothetical protein